jgi:hypothetical protein
MEYCKVAELVDSLPPKTIELEEMGIPGTSILCGFVVELLDSEEFLSVKNNDSVRFLQARSMTQEIGKLFPNPAEARIAANESGRTARVLALFDTGNCYFAWPVFD